MVGLLVLAARHLGAGRIIAMSRDEPRQRLALEFGRAGVIGRIYMSRRLSFGSRDTAEQLFDKIVRGLPTLGRHVVDHCGADGDAVVSASLLPVGKVEATVTASAHILSGMNMGLRQTPGTHELQRAVVGQHTLPLRAMHTPSTEMMVVVRLLMIDLLSLFGQAGVVQITDDATVVPGTFQSDLTPKRISDWARRWEIPTA